MSDLLAGGVSAYSPVLLAQADGVKKAEKPETSVAKIKAVGFDGFQKGERVKETKDGVVLSGSGRDMGVVKWGIDENVADATHLKITLKGKFKKDAGWSRLRIEIVGDKKAIAEQRTGDFSADAETEIPKDLSKGATVYIPVKGMGSVERISIMGVGPGTFEDLIISGIELVKR